MLAPAHVGHLAMLRSLIRRSAAEGSFDRELAADTPASEEFFSRLKRALVTGYFVEEDPRTGRIDTVSVPGYVFWPDGRHSGMPPVGFGLFRALDDGGYELWLAGLELGERGNGNGRALLAALLATPPGQKTWVVRIPRESRYAVAVHRVISDFGFDCAGDTPRLRWFVRRDAPAELASRIRGGVQSRPALN
jgi:hypothetical protein